MCGILGSTGDLRDIGPAFPDALAALRHRGPDAAAFREMRIGDRGLVLGHTRLRIIDLSPEADQPLPNEDASIWVAFNGELYNHAELRADLEARGHRFRSRSDTECLVHLYEASGGDPARMLGKLRGMFAFALADVPRGRVLLARDRLGIKPLYYAQGPGGLHFSSEVRGLARVPGVAAHPDPEALRGYLAWGVVHGPRTVLEGVRELPPGSFLVWEGGRASVERWWTPRPEPDPLLVTDAPRLLGAALADAVRRHLVADRPVGLFLSGGLDSGTVARFASATGEVRSLTVTFPEDPGDEAEAAQRWAARFGLHHQEVPVTGSEVASRLDDILAAMDQPTSDGVNAWLVAEAARRAGLVVALSGLGGDELFGGYPSFGFVPKARMAVSALRAVPAPARRAAARGAARRRAGGRLARLLAAPSGWAGAYQAVRGLFSPAELPLLGRPADSTRGARGEWPAATSSPDTVMLLEFRHYLASQILRDTDQMSMAHAVEVRVPLLDDVVVQVALALPSEARARPGKALLAEASGIANAVRKRPFALPFDRWLRGPLRAALQQGLLSEELPFAREVPLRFRRRLLEAFEAGRTHWSRPWAVVVLRLWPAANGFRW